ncbi:MAG: hypothetical protein IPO21_03955 [Bacteroidales bacterium]|nr:hypothetical protein [Bacteroidales bacterium]
MRKQLLKISFIATLAVFCLNNAAMSQCVYNDHKEGKFYHILGTLPEAYDLVKDEMVTSDEADVNKDFVDTDVSGDFSGKWKAGNTTTFVQAPGWPIQCTNRISRFYFVQN